MKIKNTHTGATYSIANAVTGQCEEYREGAVERALATSNQTAKLFGELIEMLVNKKILNEVDIVEFITYSEELVEDK